MNNEDHDLIVNLTATVQEFNDKYKQNVIQTENNTKQLVRIASSLTSLIEDNKKRDEQIESLVFSQQKELADRISQLCKQYMDMEGIPEDELQEFIDLHAAYKAVHGNHGIDTKYNYCIEHLPIIPSNRKIGEIKK